MSQGGSVIPLVGPWWQTLALRSSGSHHRPIDRALGAAATLGLSFVILRLVAQALRAAKRNGQASLSLQVVQEVLRGLFQREQEEQETAAAATDQESPSPETVLYKGSCHCRSVTFEVVAPKRLEAVHGPGKISYAHTQTRASNFRFCNGVDHLQIYYVSVPASAGTKHGVEPTIGAHTFCSRCGVHILHADSPTSSVLHVNVCCIDGGHKAKIKWNQRHYLSSGVPVEKQWEDEDENDDTQDLTTWGNEASEGATLPSCSCSKLDEAHETIGEEGTPSEHSWKDTSNLGVPGTPSTVGTVGTDSLVSAMRYRSLTLEQDSATSSEESESLPVTRPLLPPLNTSLPRPRLESSSSTTSTPTTTTPMMRDQLKYYISKHLPAPVDKPKEEGPETAQGEIETPSP